jgi:hypothetical protein
MVAPAEAVARSAAGAPLREQPTRLLTSSAVASAVRVGRRASCMVLTRVVLSSGVDSCEGT